MKIATLIVTLDEAEQGDFRRCIQSSLFEMGMNLDHLLSFDSKEKMMKIKTVVPPNFSTDFFIGHLRSDISYFRDGLPVSGSKKTDVIRKNAPLHLKEFTIDGEDFSENIEEAFDGENDEVA